MQDHERLLAKYFVPWMGLYTEANGEVTSMLRRLESGAKLSNPDCQFLQDKGLHGLAAYARHHASTGVRDRRLLQTPEDRRRRAAVERRALRDKYEIEYVEPEHLSKLHALMRRLEVEERLTDEDCRWLISIDMFTRPLRVAFHRNEAMHHKTAFERTRNPRDAVNANSHFRKAGDPSAGLALIKAVDLASLRDAKLRSALRTTMGGSLRDLGRSTEAMQAAIAGHADDQRSFHPCTLLGALHYELGSRGEGDIWFAKAVERGASTAVVDNELRIIWHRSSAAQRAEMRAHLLALDPHRYAWVRAQNPSPSRR